MRIGIFKFLPVLISSILLTPPAVADTNSDDQLIQSTKKEVVTREIAKQLDTIVDENCRSLHEVGFALAVVDHDQIVYMRCFGEAQKNTAVTPKTIFGLASITKTFTALALISLVDQGQINLDDSIAKYLPDAPSTWKNISVRQLASMTAGFPRDLTPEMPWRNGGYAAARSMTLLSAPGSKFSYSNVGYRILGQIIENVASRPLLEICRELILAPAQMTSTGVVSEFQGSPLLATPFLDDGNELRAIRYRAPGINFASGNFFSTIEDMAKYASFLLNQKVVSKQGFQTVWFERPPLSDGEPDYWAFGWGAKSIVDHAAIRKVSMNGGLPGVASTITLYPDQKIGIVSLSNLRTKGSGRIAEQVGKLLVPADQAPQEGGTIEPGGEEPDMQEKPRQSG